MSTSLRISCGAAARRAALVILTVCALLVLLPREAAASQDGPDIEVFAGLDGSKQPQDLGINANMGVRLAAGVGLPLVRRAGLGLQVGAGLNLSDAAVHVLDRIDGTSRRTQRFVTVGLFQQGVSRIVWAANVDYLSSSYYDSVSLAQARGLVGIQVSPSTELGALGSTGLTTDEALAAGTPVRLAPIGQLAGYVRRTWVSGARTLAWAGIASGHHNVVFVFPDNSRTERPVVYGAQVEMPLSGRVSVTGAANFITPAATGTVDAYLGLSFYPRRGALGRRQATSPVMPIANNPEFPVDLRR